MKVRGLNIGFVWGLADWLLAGGWLAGYFGPFLVLARKVGPRAIQKAISDNFQPQPAKWAQEPTRRLFRSISGPSLQSLLAGEALHYFAYFCSEIERLKQGLYGAWL